MNIIKLFLKQYWFFTGIILICCITIGDISGTVSKLGKLAKTHNGPEFIISLIFFTSGLLIKFNKIKESCMEIKGTIIALIAIFIAAPTISFLFAMMPFNIGIIIGLFIVSAMPTTLSTGVVMTGASNGNMAHALLITILSNCIAVFSIPITLSIQMMFIGNKAVVQIDKTAIMTKLLLFVIIPLSIGIMTNLFFKPFVNNRYNKFFVKLNTLNLRFLTFDFYKNKLQIFNQLLVLTVIWMALSDTRKVIINYGENIFIVLTVVLIFHILLVSFVMGNVIFFKLGSGKRESVIFMGGQKTLPLSILIQVAVFPQYGLALMVCVLHHLVHIIVDSFFVGKIGNWKL